MIVICESVSLRNGKGDIASLVKKRGRSLECPLHVNGAVALVFVLGAATRRLSRTLPGALWVAVAGKPVSIHRAQ